MGEEEGLNGSKGERDQTGEVGRANGTEDSPFPDTEKKLVSRKPPLALRAVVESGLIPEARKKADFEDPLDFFLKRAVVDGLEGKN